jgi:hypothetical protein
MIHYSPLWFEKIKKRTKDDLAIGTSRVVTRLRVWQCGATHIAAQLEFVLLPAFQRSTESTLSCSHIHVFHVHKSSGLSPLLL